MSLAIIADIHGNALALEAVLADIAARGIAQTINLGDVVSGPLWPRETMQILAPLHLPTVRGNHDRWVGCDDPATLYPSDKIAHDALAPAQRAWLRHLPTQLTLPGGLLAFHACPADDNAYLVERVAEGQLVRDSSAAIAARLGPTAERLILCAHSHQPQLVSLADGRMILNPGSVGCPAYDDPTPPFAHVSETATPHARYAVLVGGRVEFIAVPYDWETAARRAEQLGRPAWAIALRTGRMTSL